VATRAIAEFLGVRFQTRPKTAPRFAAAPGGEAGEVLDMLINDGSQLDPRSSTLDPR